MSSPLDTDAIDALLARVPSWRCNSQRTAAPELRAAVVALRARVAELDAELSGVFPYVPGHNPCRCAGGGARCLWCALEDTIRDRDEAIAERDELHAERAAGEAVGAAVHEPLVVTSTRRDGTMYCDVRALLDRGEIRPAARGDDEAPGLVASFEEGEAVYAPGSGRSPVASFGRLSVGDAGPVTSELWVDGVKLLAVVNDPADADPGTVLAYAGDGRFLGHGRPLATDAELAAAVRAVAQHLEHRRRA